MENRNGTGYIHFRSLQKTDDLMLQNSCMRSIPPSQNSLICRYSFCPLNRIIKRISPSLSSFWQKKPPDALFCIFHAGEMSSSFPVHSVCRYVSPSLPDWDSGYKYTGSCFLPSVSPSTHPYSDFCFSASAACASFAAIPAWAASIFYQSVGQLRQTQLLIGAWATR